MLRDRGRSSVRASTCERLSPAPAVRDHGDVDLGVADQSFLVTGGSSGIGLATARTLIDEGAWVTICGRSTERLAGACAELDSERVNAVACDVHDDASARHLVEKAVEHRGRLDGIAAMAGRGNHGSVLDLPPAEVVEEIAAKVLGLLNVVRPALDHLVATGGRIVGVTSPTARTPDPAMGAVSAGRAAVDSILSSLADELAPRNVRVNGVGVGLIDTPRQRARHAQDGHGDYRRWLRAQADQRGVPLRRAGGAEEVAAAVCWLLSTESGYTTGSLIDVTGGLRSR